MDDFERRITECLQRMHNFGTENAAAISVNAIAVAAFTAIAAFVGQLDATGALRTSAGLTKLSLTGQRRIGRTELYSFLLLMARVARDIERNNPAFINTFKIKRQNLNDVTLLETARAFNLDGANVKAEFIGYGLAADFLTTLETLTNEFDQSINAQDTANRDRIDANATIDDIIDQALNGRRTLLVIIPNIFAGNPGKLADWASASHIEKAPKKTPPTP